MKPASSLQNKLLLGGLFLLQLGAPGLWQVSFSNVLRAHGLAAYIPAGFACSAVAAFISPLIVGAMADDQVSPVRLARWLNWLSAVTLALSYLAIQRAWGGFLMIGLMQLRALCSSPCVSLATTIALVNLDRPSRQFGLLRLWGTVGWAGAGWFVSYGLAADTSPLSGYASAAVMAALGFYTYLLPETPAPAAGTGRRSWSQRLGLDSFGLLKNRDHRIVFITTVLLTIPLASFYPYAPLNLTDLGYLKPTATMAVGQISEILGLLLLGSIWRRVRLKWIFLAGLLLAVGRYSLFSLDLRGWIIAGIAMHGACYALFYVTGQIYLAERIEAGMQARAQALMALMINGIGNLIGYLGTGWWYETCTGIHQTEHWPVFWGGLLALIVVATVYFALSYHGVGADEHRRKAATMEVSV